MVQKSTCLWGASTCAQPAVSVYIQRLVHCLPSRTNVAAQHVNGQVWRAHLATPIAFTSLPPLMCYPGRALWIINVTSHLECGVHVALLVNSFLACAWGMWCSMAHSSYLGLQCNAHQTSLVTDVVNKLFRSCCGWLGQWTGPELGGDGERCTVTWLWRLPAELEYWAAVPVDPAHRYRFALGWECRTRTCTQWLPAAVPVWVWKPVLFIISDWACGYWNLKFDYIVSIHGLGLELLRLGADLKCLWNTNYYSKIKVNCILIIMFYCSQCVWLQF